MYAVLSKCQHLRTHTHIISIHVRLNNIPEFFHYQNHEVYYECPTLDEKKREAAVWSPERSELLDG